MSNKLKAVSSDPILRNYAQDASQKAVKKIANFLAPTVEVPTLTGRYKKYDAKHRFKLPDSRYIDGEKATRIGFTAADERYNLEPHALDFPIPGLANMESEEVLNQAMYGADLLAEASGLIHEMDVITKALAAAGAGETLNLKSSDDPVDAMDAAIMEVLKAARNSAGIRILFGTSAFRIWKNAAKVLARFNGVAKVLKTPNLADTSAMLMFDPECEMSQMVVDTAPEGVDPEIEWALDSAVLIYACNPHPTTMDASFMKTFRLKNKWMVPDDYQTEDKRAEVLKFDWVCQPTVTNTAAIKRLNFTNE